MKKYIIFVLFFFSVFSAAEAYLLNSSEIIGKGHFVLQASYLNKNFGDQVTQNRQGTEIKLGYGFTDPLDGFIYLVPGKFSEIADQTFQTVGINIEYGIMKGIYGEKTLVDISIIGGYEKTTIQAGGTKVSEENIAQLGFIIGKSLRRPYAYTTPYVGSKISFVSPSNAGPQNDYELILGIKFGLNRYLSLQLEGSYHWIKDSSSTINASEIALGLAYGN